MKVLFIKKPYNNILDGGDIYNKKLIASLNNIKDVIIHEFDIRNFKKGLIPFWKWKISNSDIKVLKKIIVDYDKIIISHENLADLTKHIRCDIFIFQNIMSLIRGNLFAYQALYKIGAKKHENIAIQNSKYSIVLSHREFNLLAKDKIFHIPPGINESILTEKTNKIYLPSSRGWLLKKASNLSKKEIMNFEKYFKVSNESKLSKVGIIEDKFDCGFKLRLIQMLYNCDVILTKLDFSHEIKSLNCDPQNVHVFKDFSAINLKKILKNVDNNVNMKNKKILSENHNWREKASLFYKILSEK